MTTSNSNIRPDTGYSLPNLINYAISQRLLDINTALPCEIKAITGSTYTIQSLVNYLDSTQNPTAAPLIYNVPAITLMGGNAGVITQLEVGDTVLVVFFQRDISLVKQNWAQSNPASFRKFNLADAAIITKITNTLPDIYVKITRNGGIEITAPEKPVNINCKNTTVTAETCDIKAGEINLGVTELQKVLIENIPMTATLTNVQAGTDTVTSEVTVTFGGSSIVKAGA